MCHPKATKLTAVSTWVQNQLVPLKSLIPPPYTCSLGLVRSRKTVQKQSQISEPRGRRQVGRAITIMLGKKSPRCVHILLKCKAFMELNIQLHTNFLTLPL